MKEIINNLEWNLDNSDLKPTIKNLVTDATKTAIYAVLDPVKWIGKTTKKIGNAIHKSYTEWNFWKKIRKVPASLIATPLMAVEWVAETLFHSSYNVARNTANTLSNPLTNSRKSIEWAFDNDEKKNPKMRLASLF